jgi:hypothetical protein
MSCDAFVVVVGGGGRTMISNYQQCSLGRDQEDFV